MAAKREEQESRTTTHSSKEALGEPAGASSYADEKKIHPRDRGSATEWKSPATVTSRNPQFMVFTHGMGGLQPLAAPELLEQGLRNSPEIEVLDVLTPRNVFGLFGDGVPGSQKIIVVRMDEQKASMLARQAGPQLAIERDNLLIYGHTAPYLPIAPGNLRPALGFTATFKVMANNAPVEGAQIDLFGNVSLTQGITDRQGMAELDVTGESPTTIRAVYVKPQSDYWTLWIAEPAINPSGDNVLTLTSLSTTFPGFPRQQLVGWGQKVMKFDQLPPSYRGRGIKIAIIDSGVAGSHAALRGQLKSGYDAIMRSQQGWDEDAVGNGTHCAGIICGRSSAGSGIQGIAPESELIVCKVSPGGSYSSLFEALDFCLAEQADVIHLSLGTFEPSQIIEQKIVQAKQMGVACIVAAGDSGGPVHYPASSSHVFAVAALGKQGEFPAQSFHALTMAGLPVPSGFFSPGFSCFGPQVAVCAPGVAVISSVPPDNFAALDGTSVAAAHVTGLAALILAHHPEFQAQGPFNVRSAHRVERLFQIIKQSAQPVGVGDPLRAGAGLPDAALAFTAMPAAADLTHQLSRGLPYPGFSFPMAWPPGSMPIASPLTIPTPARDWALPQQGPVNSAQGNMANFLLAIQQLRAIMQSAGLF